MTRHLLRLLAALFLVFIAVPAYAQWQVPNHAVPVGKGAGVIGFGSAAPATAGQVLLDKGSSTNPAFTALGGDVSAVNSSGSVTLDPEIHCLAALTSAADKIAYYTGSGTCSLTDFTSTARSVLDDTSTSAMRTTLGLAIGTDVQAFDSDLTIWSGITPGTGVGIFLATPSSANLRSALTDEVGTGAAYFVGGALGQPASADLTNATNLPVGSGISGLGSGVATFLGTPSSANLRGAITDETGTGAAVFASSPALTGTVDVQQALLVSGDISPAQITSNQNDYAPTGFSTSAVLRLDLDADRSITGIAGGSDGLVKIIHNISTHVLTLKNQDVGSSAANRLLLGGDVTLNPDTSITLQYDSTSSRWRAITSPGSGGGGGGGGVSSVTVAAGFGLSTSGTCTITTSGTCTVSLADQQRQNSLLNCAGVAKALAGYQRTIETFCDGYKASDGVAAGSSSNYTVDTSGGKVGPTTAAGASRFPTNMTGASAPPPYVASSNAHFSTFDAWQLFDGSNTSYWQDASVAGTDTLKIDLGSGNAVAVASYSLTANNTAPANMIKTWTFEGSNDNSAWTTLDTQASQTAWSATESRTFTLAAVSAAYRYFRLQVTAGNSAGNYVVATWQATGPVTTNNMTVVTTTQTADATVGSGRVLMEIDPIDSITLNTDLTAEVTCNGGTNWASGTLSSVGKGQSGRTVVETADTSCGANTGTSFAARVKSLNNKSVNVYKTTVTVH